MELGKDKNHFEMKPAKISDCQALSSLAKETFYDTFSKIDANLIPFLKHYVNRALTVDYFKKIVSENEEFVQICVQTETLIGYMELNKDQPPTKFDGNSLQLLKIYCRASVHGQGVGKMLLCKAESLARKYGCNHLWLGVWDINLHAIEFYKRRGFKQMGFTPWVYKEDKYGRCDQDLLMIKSLR